MKMTMHKITVDDKFYGKTEVAVPKFSADKEIFNKLSGEFLVSVRQYRNLVLHNLLYEVATFADSECGVLDFYRNKTNIVDELEEAVRPEVVEILLAQYKYPKEVLVHLCKWIFLPLEKKTKPNGDVIYDVCSISFENMDNLVFQEFCDKCFKLWADKIGISKKQLLDNAKAWKRDR
jgi:hypothetical protein